MSEGNVVTEQKLENTNGTRPKCLPESNSYRNEFYNMNHKYRGKAIICNHEHFEIDLKPRPGTEKDCENLEKCLNDLGFSVDVLSNPKYGEVMYHIKKTASMNHSKNDCLLIVVLTHGTNGMLYAKDTHYRPEKLWNLFTEENCPTLAGKPKLFVFQACQGEEYDDGITLTKNIETDGWFEPNRNPTHPDFLVAKSTVPGYYSWRNSTRGSYFITALCEELYYSGKTTDILTLLTFVCQNVALNFESSTDEDISNEKKQVPCISSTLTRRLVFSEKPDRSKDMNSFVKCFEDNCLC
nr:caspase-1 [Helicoverpa armigera]